MRFKKATTKFLEKILSVKNENIYKVIRILGIKIKIKSRHREVLSKFFQQEKEMLNRFARQEREMLSKFTQQEKEIKSLYQQISNNNEDLKKLFVEQGNIAEKNIIQKIGNINERLVEQKSSFEISNKQTLDTFTYKEYLNYTQLESFFWLAKHINIKNSLPPLRGWPMSPDILLKLHQYIISHKPKVVVEFGSGSSTIVICDALRQNGFGSLISIDHLEEYAQKTMQFITNEGLESFLDLRIAPVEKWNGEHLADDASLFWYAKEALKDIKDIDLLIVDGPPGATCTYARYPALPALYEKFNKTVQIWVDDSSRKDEKDICNAWAKKYGFELEFFDLEKGLAILSR